VLADTPGIQDLDSGLLLTIGPLTLLLSKRELDGRAWLLAGTVTPDTLQRAAAELTAGPAVPDDRQPGEPQPRAPATASGSPMTASRTNHTPAPTPQPAGPP